MATASAEIVTFDLDSLALPSGASTTFATPYNENGLRLTSNVGSMVITGQGSVNFPGVKAMVPGEYANGQAVVMGLSSPTGRMFTVRSMTLHPWAVGTAMTVAFTGWRNGNGMMQSQSTGTTLAGNTVTFNSNFERIGALEWRMTQVGGVYQRYQISRIEVEFDGVLSAPSEIVVNEAAGTAMIPISLDHPRSTDTEVIREVAQLTASDTADFTLPGGVAFAPLIIPAGQTTAYLTVPLINDTLTEGIETFRVTYSANTPGTAFAAGATFSMVTVKIASDDGVTTFPNWMATHGLSSTQATPTADPNGDGISNIESWLFRLNPAGPNPTAWLGRRAAWTGGTTDPGLRMIVPLPLPADVRIMFSQSTDMLTWTEQTRRTGFSLGSLWTGPSAARVIETNNLSGRTITLRASVPQGPRPQLFLNNAYEYVPSSVAD